MLEHRYHRRVPFTLDVILRTRRGETMACRVKDVGNDGIGLDCDDMALREGAIVEVEVPASAMGREHCSLRSFVVHAGNGRVGLMWLDGESVPACLQPV